MKAKQWRTLFTVINAILSVVLALLGAYYTGHICEKLHCEWINSWSMLHFWILIFLPLYVVISFILLDKTTTLIICRIYGYESLSPLRLCRLAIISFALNLLPILNIIGIVLAFKARSLCKSNANLRGAGLALAGLIIAGIQILYFVFMMGYLFVSYLINDVF